jgi:hypothetical protein
VVEFLRFEVLARKHWAVRLRACERRQVREPGWQSLFSPEPCDVLRLWSFAISDPGLSVWSWEKFPGKNPVGDGCFPFFEFAFDAHGHRRPPPILGVTTLLS